MFEAIAAGVVAAQQTSPGEIGDIFRGIIVALWAVVTILGGIVWAQYNARLKKYEERLEAMDQSILYLREQGHELRNLIPSPHEAETRRRETRENFDRVFEMLREIEKQQNTVIGEMRSRG